MAGAETDRRGSYPARVTHITALSYSASPSAEKLLLCCGRAGTQRSVFLLSAWQTHFAPQKSAACLTLRALAQPHAACLPDLTPEPSARRTSACLPSPCRKPPRRRRAAARARLEPDDTNDSDEGEEGLAQAEHELQPGARLKRRRRPQSPKIARLRRRRPSRARDPQPCPVGRRLLPASPAWWSRLPA